MAMNSKPTRISAPRTSMRLSSMTFWILFFSSVIYSPRSRPSSSPRHKNDARYPLWRGAAKNYLPDYTFWRLEKPLAFRANHLSRNCRSQPTCPRDIRRHLLDQVDRAQGLGAAFQWNLAARAASKRSNCKGPPGLPRAVTPQGTWPP